MAAHQAPPSLGFSRQEHRSGLPFPSPMHASQKWKWRWSVVSDPQRPHGLQPSRSSIHGIFQAGVLEWGAIAFSKQNTTEELKQQKVIFSQLWKLEVQARGTRCFGFSWGLSSWLVDGCLLAVFSCGLSLRALLVSLPLFVRTPWIRVSSYDLV